VFRIPAIALVNLLYPEEEAFRHMLEKEDQKLKAEIDAIMDNVKTIMGRVESVIPTRKEEADPKKETS
jgi:hypothetical protein